MRVAFNDQELERSILSDVMAYLLTAPDEKHIQDTPLLPDYLYLLKPKLVADESGQFAFTTLFDAMQLALQPYNLTLDAALQYNQTAGVGASLDNTLEGDAELLSNLSLYGFNIIFFDIVLGANGLARRQINFFYDGLRSENDKWVFLIREREIESGSLYYVILPPLMAAQIYTQEAQKPINYPFTIHNPFHFPTL